MDLPFSEYVVCFWKQNDLGLYNRRADRWISFWSANPAVKKVVVVEPPITTQKLKKWMQLVTALPDCESSEYELLLANYLHKKNGLMNCDKIIYLHDRDLFDENGFINLNIFSDKLGRLGVSNPLFFCWPYFPMSESFLSLFIQGRLVVDYVDDQREFYSNEENRRGIGSQYAALGQLAVARISNSHDFCIRLAEEFRFQVDCVPNNILTSALNTLVASNDSKNNVTDTRVSVQTKTRPVAGYVGNLRGRIDSLKLISLVRSMPQWDFWFIGQTHRGEFYEAAKRIPNCYFFGTRPRKLIDELLIQFDLALVPFVKDSLTDSMDFLKLMDYHELKTPILDFREKSLSTLRTEMEDCFKCINQDLR